MASDDLSDLFYSTAFEIAEDDFESDTGRALYRKIFRRSNNVSSLDEKRLERRLEMQRATGDVGVVENTKADGHGPNFEQCKRVQKPTLQAPVAENLYCPNILDIRHFYECHGLVGDVDTSILITLGAIHKLRFGIESLSGSGKTVSLDILLKLFEPDDYYILKLSSDKAALYDSESINKAKILVITELQKSATRTMIDVLKDLGEGKAAERKVTNQERTGVVKQELDYDKAIIYTLALENWFKKDKELERRYFTLTTDVSEAQTKKIIESIAAKEFDGHRSIGSFLNLKKYMRECLSSPKKEYCNPFAAALIEGVPATIKARSFINHYFSLMQACAKFHSPKRVQQGGTVFLNLEDAHLIHELYGGQFLRSVLGVPFYGDKLLYYFAEQNSLGFSEINGLLRQDGVCLSQSILSNSLEELINTGYLEKVSGKNHFDGVYSLAKDMPQFSSKIDWLKVWTEADELMSSNHPDIYEDWVKSNIKDGLLYVSDPVQQQKKLIFEMK